jgi:ATP-binding cassette, subfamily C (CFTR/MRP), member 1
MVPSLDMPIAEGGGNLSTGQRQLLSLARAVLLRRKVLLMDEVGCGVWNGVDWMGVEGSLRG